MKTTRENISIFISRDVLKRLMAEYWDFDEASRLCADYCITADDLAALIREIPKPERSKSRLTSTMRSDKPMDIGEAYRVARQAESGHRTAATVLQPLVARRKALNGHSVEFWKKRTQ